MSKRVLVIGVMMLCFVAGGSATTIEWVTSDASYDQPWIDLLTAQGYTVNASSWYYVTLNATKIAQLEAADLIIFSRKNGSGDYSSSSDNGYDEPATWNGITTPMINCHINVSQSNRWNVFEKSWDKPNITGPMTVVVPSDPIFWGVPLDDNNAVDILVFGGQADISPTFNAGNGTVLARMKGMLEVWIARWNTGDEYYVGAGQYAGGPRVFFGVGDAPTGSSLNLNVAGQQLFLNIAYAMSGASFDRPPLVDAGVDEIVYLGNVLELNGSSVDPDSTPTVTWSQVSGPGTAAFDDTSSPVTSVSFDAAGTYVLQLEATDGTSIVTDTATVYVKDHADDALLAHWDFDDLASDANSLLDVSGNGLDGVYYSLSHSGPVVVAGHIDGSVAAADLAADSYWDIGDPNLTGADTGITIAAWVNVDENTGYPMIVGYGLDGWRLQVSDNTWNFACTPAGIDLKGVYPPIDGFWHHVAAVYDGANSKAKIYVDGLLNAEQTVASGTLLSEGTKSLQVGSRADGPRIWPGLIDDIQIYNYPLSDSAIALLASEGDVLPQLTAGDDQTLQYTGTGIQLDATVILDDGIPSPLALTWEVITAPNGVNLGDVVFNDNTIEDPTVTFPNAAGTYIFQLTGDDTVVQVSDQVSIVIYIPTCAQVLADGLGFDADLSGPAGVPDCYVNIYDLAAIAVDWLKCNNPQDAACVWPY